MTGSDDLPDEPGSSADRRPPGATEADEGAVAVAGGLPPDEVDGAEAAPGLGRSATRGAGIVMAGQITKLSIHFAGLLILARLLSPDDYGLVAMVTALTAVGEVIRDFGLSSAAVQARSLTPEQRGALFWINTAIGAGLTLVVMVAAGPIAALYGEPDLTAITRGIALVFLINGLSSQFRADLNRDMRFVAYSVVDVGGHLIGLVAAVVVALLGGGPWALVAQQLGQKGGVLVLSAVASGRAPGWPRRGVALGPLVRFGSNLMGMQLLGHASRQVDSFTIGLRFGPEALGLYDRAFQLLMLPLNQLSAPSTTVALPVLSRLRDDRERYDAYLLRGQGVMLHMVMAVFAFATAVAWPAIPLVLGDQWEDAVPLFRILAVGGVFHAATYACYWVVLSKGLTREGFRFQLFSRPVMIAMIVAAGFVSPTAVAATYALALALGWPAELWWISHISDAPAFRMFGNGVRTMVGYGIAGLAAYGATQVAGDLSEVAIVAVAGVVMAVVVALVVVAWPAFRRDLVGAVRQGVKLMPGGLRRRLGLGAG